MKKSIKFLLMGAFCISVIYVNAQQCTPGIKGGVNFASLTGFEGNPRIGAHAGFFVHKSINKSWCFQPELLYSGEGQRYLSDGEERMLSLDYIQAPFMIQYFPIQQLYLEFGPQVGFLVSARDRGDNSPKVNVKSDFTNAQFGLNVGTGVYVTPNIGIYGRYSFGLTDVSKFDNIVDQSNVGQVGMMIRLKTK